MPTPFVDFIGVYVLWFGIAPNRPPVHPERLGDLHIAGLGLKLLNPRGNLPALLSRRPKHTKRAA
jgi:hypothetical protein